MIVFVGEETAGADRVPYGCRRVPKIGKSLFKDLFDGKPRSPILKGTT